MISLYKSSKGRLFGVKVYLQVLNPRLWNQTLDQKLSKPKPKALNPKVHGPRKALRTHNSGCWAQRPYYIRLLGYLEP